MFAFTIANTIVLVPILLLFSCSEIDELLILIVSVSSVQQFVCLAFNI